MILIAFHNEQVIKLCLCPTDMQGLHIIWPYCIYTNIIKDIMKLRKNNIKYAISFSIFIHTWRAYLTLAKLISMDLFIRNHTIGLEGRGCLGEEADDGCVIFV